MCTCAYLEKNPNRGVSIRKKWFSLSSKVVGNLYFPLIWGEGITLTCCTINIYILESEKVIITRTWTDAHSTSGFSWAHLQQLNSTVLGVLRLALDLLLKVENFPLHVPTDSFIVESCRRSSGH